MYDKNESSRSGALNPWSSPKPVRKPGSKADEQQMSRQSFNCYSSLLELPPDPSPHPSLWEFSTKLAPGAKQVGQCCSK